LGEGSPPSLTLPLRERGLEPAVLVTLVLPWPDGMTPAMEGMAGILPLRYFLPFNAISPSPGGGGQGRGGNVGIGVAAAIGTSKAKS
jgi:hypothetical protein